MIPGSFKTIDLKDQPVSHWSGGSTTELAIWPESAQYSKRNFKWRISCATLVDETSSFTPLAGFKRNLMLLEGTCRLVHDGHHEKVLEPYVMDSFDGSWTTHSFGQATDFNLIYAPEVNAVMSSVCVTGQMSLAIENENSYKNAFLLFFSQADSFEVSWQQERVELVPQTLLVIAVNNDFVKDGDLSIRHQNAGEGRVVFTRIYE